MSCEMEKPGYAGMSSTVITISSLPNEFKQINVTDVGKISKIRINIQKIHILLIYVKVLDSTFHIPAFKTADLALLKRLENYNNFFSKPPTMLLPSHEKVLYSQFQVSNSKTLACRSWTPAPSSSSDNSHGSTYENLKIKC